MKNIENSWILTSSICTILFVVVSLAVSYKEDEERYSVSNIQNLCPNMVHTVFDKSSPRDDDKAGLITEYKIEGDVDLRSCVAACCEKKNNTCNVVFLYKETCYHVRCVSNAACLPKERSINDRLQMVLVSPVTDDTSNEGMMSWIKVLNNEKIGDTFSEEQSEKLNFWTRPHKLRIPAILQEADSIPYDEEEPPTAAKRINQILLERKLDNLYGNDRFLQDDSEIRPADDIPFYEEQTKFNACKLGLDNSCPPNEECVKIGENSHNGICKCLERFQRNQRGECIKMDLDYSADTIVEKILANSQKKPMLISVNSEPGDFQKSETEIPKEEKIKKLTVSVASKTLKLPNKEETLAAYTVPDEASSGDTYKYLWTLVSQPTGAMNGTISDQSKSKVKLSNLSEGLYTFKVTVTGNGSYGEAIGNVTVLPEERINKIPEAIITPQELTIKLPNTQAILDGSTSRDDDRIVNWQWELISGPIGYQPKLPEKSTLQLTDLSSPGNYTFKLTVTDSDGAKNSTTRNITVLKTTDYPPSANAGTDVILYLPHNNVTLNGTMSKDDHEIVAWEWTQDDTVQGKAVDMQNTRSPYLELSNLEEGIYTFVLKVTDASGQSNSAKVDVFVKPPTNSPPIANAGSNTTISLPQNWIALNGTLSTDDIRITNYLWKQIAGPNNAVIANAKASIANATSLTIGLYEFELSVSDENENTANDRVWIKVVQEKNAPPVADAGGHQSLTLPVSAVYLNGTRSSDDLGIVNYTWTRDGASLAVGSIIDSSDRKPVLILTNVVPGRYVFKLTVWDNQGLSSSDTVSIILRRDPIEKDLVEVTLSVGISVLTSSELESIQQKIILLIGDVKMHVRELKVDPKTDEGILVFYIERTKPDGKTDIVPGIQIEKILKDKLWRDATILGTTFTDVRTSICQNQCSNHGVCNSVTRSCICEAFWMPSIFYYWYLDDANCDWSVLYVVIGVLAGFFMLSGIFWGISCACRRLKVQKYALIDTQDEEIPSFPRSTCLTDSDADSDVLFESRSKQNGVRRLNGSARSHSHKYPTTKLGRRIKT